MDIQPQTQQPISDDQELAKVLAGISGDDLAPAGDMVPAPSTPMPDAVAPVAVDEPAEDVADETPVSLEAPAVAEPEAPEVPELPAAPAPPVEVPELPAFEPADSPEMPAPAADSELDQIKQEALGELRPLVDKLDVSPEEKFDTYLLLLRSTDDKTLIAPAHESAKNIADEARRAQALLDVIKEIDFLSGAHAA